MNLQSLINDVPIQGEYSLEGLEFITSADQYLSFKLEDEIYAVEILSVEEIRSWQKPTLIPNAPKHVKGVINMRGSIVPIIDLRIKFNVGKALYTPTTVVIVLALDTATSVKKMGFVVDAVEDVINTQKENIKPYFPIGECIDSRYIDGLINVNEGIVSLLNLQALHIIDDAQGNEYD